MTKTTGKKQQDEQEVLFNCFISKQIATALERIKTSEGISKKAQVTFALTAWLKAKGITLKPEPKVRSRKGTQR